MELKQTEIRRRLPFGRMKREEAEEGQQAAENGFQAEGLKQESLSLACTESKTQALEQKIREKIMAERSDAGCLSDEALAELINVSIAEELGQMGISFLSLSERMKLHQALFNGFRRLGILQELIDDRSVSEIMVNSVSDIFIERNGRTERWRRKFDVPEQLEDIIQQIVSAVNRTVNMASPIADARLPDGSRVHIVLPPAALDGPKLTIRKFPEPVTMEKLIAWRSITEEAAYELRILVAAGYNLFISGGTNSGKTTFLNALSAFIPETERVITIEDSAELQLRHLPNLVRLETRNANTEGEGMIDMSELIRASLRMNPSRIVVGEVRGREALDMLQAMNTGHDGSLSTGHANSAEDMLNRLEAMVLMGAALPVSAIRRQIASAVDLIVHLGRMNDGSRRVMEIVEMERYEQDRFILHKLFSYDAKEKRLKRTGQLKNREKLRRSGRRLPNEWGEEAGCRTD